MDLVAAWRRAQLAELVWDDEDGTGPDAAVVVPLTDDGVPCVALPYDHLARADRLAAAGSAVISIADTTLAAGAPTMKVRASVRRSDDPTGARFEDSKMLLQELAKHPPSRRRLDSILLRREHWWYLPRILLHLEPVEDPQPLTPRGALLGHHLDGRLTVTSVGIARTGTDELILDASAPVPSRGPAVVLRHGAEPPDLERRWMQRWHGELTGERLTVGRHETLGREDRSPGLIRRVRDEWALERSCREGLRAVGREA